ncbi:hypothetical protein CH373_09400 [Leptospira perolatii]|uniref:Uncharacterized protein n=1 Tax=Leptospira perolatii TaxID=2023191 RepID=A0A2M9ZMA0_9LEPT|nr:hypothetical protein CH360_15900 [Leptospira perolatii]PJZ73196.1 hypothetical protein CH373_09400 [Leptospira perolatii]
MIKLENCFLFVNRINNFFFLRPFGSAKNSASGLRLGMENLHYKIKKIEREDLRFACSFIILFSTAQAKTSPIQG